MTNKTEGLYLVAGMAIGSLMGLIISDSIVNALTFSIFGIMLTLMGIALYFQED